MLLMQYMQCIKRAACAMSYAKRTEGENRHLWRHRCLSAGSSCRSSSIVTCIVASIVNGNVAHDIARKCFCDVEARQMVSRSARDKLSLFDGAINICINIFT